MNPAPQQRPAVQSPRSAERLVNRNHVRQWTGLRFRPWYHGPWRYLTRLRLSIPMRMRQRSSQGSTYDWLVMLEQGQEGGWISHAGLGGLCTHSSIWTREGVRFALWFHRVVRERVRERTGIRCIALMLLWVVEDEDWCGKMSDRIRIELKREIKVPCVSSSSAAGAAKLLERLTCRAARQSATWAWAWRTLLYLHLPCPLWLGSVIAFLSLSLLAGRALITLQRCTLSEAVLGMHRRPAGAAGSWALYSARATARLDVWAVLIHQTLTTRGSGWPRALGLLGLDARGKR